MPTCGCRPSGPHEQSMQINQIVYRWYGLDDVPADWAGCVATIGVFDGVHLGHQRVVARAGQVAQSMNLPLVVITFDPHPDEVIRPGSHPAVPHHPSPPGRAAGRPGGRCGVRAPVQRGILPAEPG
jgi:hypothetical protein